MNELAVDVIIPCYNYGRFVAGAIESALSQTLRPASVTVVDDGSSDDSAVVARRYAPDVEVVTQENRGLERTCNEAVSRATSPYYVILSADDLLEPTYLEELGGALTTSGASFAYSDMRYIGAREGIFRSKPFSVWSLMRCNYVNASAVVSREACLRSGGYYEPEPGDYRTGLEDWELWLRMTAHGYSGVYMPKPLLLYRRHETGSRHQEDLSEWPRTIAAVRPRYPSLYRKRRYRALERPPFARWLDDLTVRPLPARVMRAVDRLILGGGVRV